MLSSIVFEWGSEVDVIEFRIVKNELDREANFAIGFRNRCQSFVCLSVCHNVNLSISSNEESEENLGKSFARSICDCPTCDYTSNVFSYFEIERNCVLP